MFLPCLAPFRLRVLGVSSSSSVLKPESSGEWMIGTAPYEPVPSAGDDRISSGAFDIMPRKILVHQWTSFDVIGISWKSSRALKLSELLVSLSLSEFGECGVLLSASCCLAEYV